mgnify:FL=1
MLYDKPPRHHRPDVVEESGQDHFHRMNHNKSDEGKTGNKMNRPRRLPPTEHREQPGERRIDRRRHRKARQNNQWCRHKQNHDIGEFLQHILPLGLISFGMPGDDVIFDCLAGWSPIARGMPADQRIGRKEQAIEDKEPRKEQVLLPSHRQNFGARSSRPRREGPALAINSTYWSKKAGDSYQLPRLWTESSVPPLRPLSNSRICVKIRQWQRFPYRGPAWH